MTTATTLPAAITTETTPEWLDSEQCIELLALAQSQLNEQWDTLLSKYPAQCVAMFSYGRYFVAPDSATLDELLAKSGFDPAKAALRWLYPHLKPGHSFGKKKSDPIVPTL